MEALLTKILDELRGSWRFRWIGLVVAGVICLLGWAGVLMLPSIYEARARVYVDTQSALKPLLQGLAVAPNVESNLALVRQALLSRPQLERVARKTDLDLRATTPREKEALILSLQQRIVITTDARANNTASDGTYFIRFQDESRAKSIAVVDTLLTSFVEDTLGTKRTGQEVAQRFLREQIADYEKRLSEAETRLADFKKRNVGRMPDQRGDYFARLQAEVTGLENAQKQLRLSEARREELQRQLSGEEPFVFGFDAESAANTQSTGAGDLTGRIQDLERREEELLLRFTEKHPEVIGVRRTLDELRAKQKEELERLRKGRGTGSLANSAKANPVYQSLKLELNRTEVAVAEQRSDVNLRSAQVAALRQLVDTVPEVEADVARLNRDYEVTRAQYLQLVQRLETARISEEADQTGTVKFEVIDPPAAGLQPVSPNRRLLLAAVLLIGLAGGAAATYLINLIRPVFQSTRALTEITGLPVIGTVSRMWLTKHQTEQRRDLLVFAGSAAMLIVGFIVVLKVGDAAAQLLFRLKG